MAHRDARKLVTIGTLLVVAAVVGGYVYPGLINRVDAVRGTISQAQFLTGDGGRSSHRRIAMLSVDYVANGVRGHLEESVTTTAGFGEQLYRPGNQITVYVRRGKAGGYGTLAEPKPLIYVWVGVGIFGLAWIVLGWLMGRPTRRRRLGRSE